MTQHRLTSLMLAPLILASAVMCGQHPAMAQLAVSDPATEAATDATAASTAAMAASLTLLEQYVAASASQNTATAAMPTYQSAGLSLRASQASYADTVDKAQADCLVQAQAVLKAGLQPAAPCQ